MRRTIHRLLPLIPVTLVAAGCAVQSEEFEETQVIGQMLRGGQSANGESFLSFDVLLTESGNGPAIACSSGQLSVTVEVSTNKGKTYKPVSATNVQVVCEDSVGPDVALVIDNSGSQEGQLEALRAASRSLLDDVKARGGRASLVRVSTESTVLHDLSDDTSSVIGALGDLHISNGWTALYDGIRIGNETLGGSRATEDGSTFESAEEFCGINPRRAIVAFTDGHENNSMNEHANEDYPGDGIDTRFDDLQSLKVRGTKTPVYTIGLGNDVDHTELNRLGTQTGGKHHSIDNLDELAETFDHVAGYSGRRFHVCGDLGQTACGRTDVRMSYSWTDGSRTLSGSEKSTINLPCAEGEPENTPGRTATLLLTLGNPGIPGGDAKKLINDTVTWVSPVGEPRVLVVLDDNHHDEFASDAKLVAKSLKALGVDVTSLDEPEFGIDAADVAGFDVVWFSNPGYPMDDELSFSTLLTAVKAGTGVVLQGDDMAFSFGNSFDMSPLTHLSFRHNGTDGCGLTTNDNDGSGAFRVEFDANSPVGGGINPFTYGDDIDWATPKQEGEQVVAWSTVVKRKGGTPACGSGEGVVPAIVLFDPIQ